VLSPEEERGLLAGGVGPAPPTASELATLDPGRAVALTRSPELGEIDVFFVALHGGSGEDGTIQALLDVAGVAYTGSDRLGCSLAMDKEISKRLLRASGIPTPDWLLGPASADKIVGTLGLPVIVKAVSGGSSLRLVLAHDGAELDTAIAESETWDDMVLFERYVPGRELTVGVVGGTAMPVGEIIPANEIFDYECKYQPGMAEEIFPAEIDAVTAAEAQRLALLGHRALKLRGYSRIDFRLDAEGELWCLEANTLPGMTAASLFPKGAAAAGIAFGDVCGRICSLALQEHGGSRRVE
jgi:D-alanine-D-alanine ligase